MKLTYKKSIMLIFSLLLLLSLFKVNTANAQATEKLTFQKQELYNSITKEKQKEYLKIKKIKPKNPLAKEQKKKFNHFSKSKNNRYIVIGVDGND